MKPQETAYVPHRGVLPTIPPPSTRQRGKPVLAPILTLCAIGWLAVGILLLVVDSHSWDVIIPITLLTSAFYLFLARWAYRDWRDKRNTIPRNLDTVRRV